MNDLITQLTTTGAALLRRPETLLVGLLASVAVLLWVAHRVRKIASSDRPDDALSNLVMLIGLGWSSEAVWEIARNRLHFPLGLTLLLFFVFEALLGLSMIRAKRHMRDFGWPGRPGNTAWTVAAAMATVAAFASASLAEAALRVLIPLLVTKQWWDGLIGGAVKPASAASTWRWTPRRLLLALGAIEPGERDVQMVHRDRLTQQMTNLYHNIQHGTPRLRERRTARLARLSLTADDDIIAEVQRRTHRALWFTPPTTTTVVAPLPAPAVPTPHPAPPTAGDTEPPTPPAATPEPVTADRTDAPTPAQVAARITPDPAKVPLRPTAARPATADTRKPQPRTTAPTSPAGPLAAPATDTTVNEPEPAQLTLPYTVDPALLSRAREIASQYRTEHGTPIKAGQLAARLRVNSEQATQALTVLGIEPGNPTTDTPAVNGRPVKATR